MKIIQLLSVTNGENPGTVDTTIYGLGDDGCVYELYSPRPPKKIDRSYGNPEFRRGSSGGWMWVAASQDRAQPIYHPEDPSFTDNV